MIHILSPLNQCPMTSQNMALRTAGCTMAFSFARCAASVKMIEPSFFLSRDPSSCTTWSPKCAFILARAGVPGSTTWRAMTSASTMGSPFAFRRVDTVDLPVAIPPVKPTTESTGLGVVRGSVKCDAHRACRGSWSSMVMSGRTQVTPVPERALDSSLPGARGQSTHQSILLPSFPLPKYTVEGYKRITKSPETSLHSMNVLQTRSYY